VPNADDYTTLPEDRLARLPRRRCGRGLRQTRKPDARWFGAAPQLLVEHRGPAAQAMIDRIEAAVARYPWGT
jgi:hypothetical protein